MHAPIPPLEPGPVVHVSGINRGRIAGSSVIAANAEIDGEEQLIGHEAVLSRWHVAGCANCQSHLESKAAFPIPAHLHELANSRPDAITVSVHTRHGLHGGVPIPVGTLRRVQVRIDRDPTRVELDTDGFQPIPRTRGRRPVATSRRSPRNIRPSSSSRT